MPAEGRLPLLPLARLSPSGFFMLVIIAAAFGLGNVRQELALSLVGAILLSVWMYCLVLGFIVALIHRGACRMRVELSPRDISVGMAVETVCKGGPRLFRIPGILIRCRLCLETRDGRRLEHIFDPGLPAEPLRVSLRGAYYAKEDELRVLDAFHIFAFSWPLRREAEARLLVSPRPADEGIPVRPRPGGREQRSGLHYLRNDDLIDHRPYIPGDDPRRINWKLYSHGPSNSLFVREGESEPPPQSRLLILVDTETDAALYKPEAGREALDLLCVQALTLALDLAGRGMDLLTGYTGGRLRGGEELARAMAWPASLPLPAPGKGPAEQPPELPSADRGTCILALPRTSVGTDALDRFLTRRASAPMPCEILFLYPENASEQVREAAETCARLYGSRNAVRAWAVEAPL
ncbi:MAG: DUF58 domain-containing protein [Treponema sp.]|jgi:hypothetical protein|nr:DUF58 domain-containing protein [Treponema sp.]